jgi:hypothetical protein
MSKMWIHRDYPETQIRLPDHGMALFTLKHRLTNQTHIGLFEQAKTPRHRVDVPENSLFIVMLGFTESLEKRKVSIEQETARITPIIGGGYAVEVFDYTSVVIDWDGRNSLDVVLSPVRQENEDE